MKFQKAASGILVSPCCFSFVAMTKMTRNESSAGSPVWEEVVANRCLRDSNPRVDPVAWPWNEQEIHPESCRFERDAAISDRITLVDWNDPAWLYRH